MSEESEKSTKRPAQRKTKREATHWATKTVALESDAHSTLEKAAKKLGTSNARFASAAIRYFTENGLDPTKTTTVAENVQTRARVSEASLEIRKLTADVGNRLIAILRTWEREQYGFLQAQQAGIFAYLERIEANILAHQVAVESQVLAPMFERLMRNGIDTHMTRMLTEILLLRSKSTPFLTEELKISNADFDGQRDRRLVTEMRKLLETVTVPTPTVSAKANLTPPPASVTKAAATPAGAAAKS